MRTLHHLFTVLPLLLPLLLPLPLDCTPPVSCLVSPVTFGL